MSKIMMLLCSLFASYTSANEKLLFEQFQQAMRQHNMKVLNSLIAPTANIKMVWADSEPKQKFTLSKAQYLQQVRALWRFGTEDSYQFEQVKWQQSDDANKAQFTFRQTEKRVLFTNASGQRSDVSLQLIKVGQSWQIVAMNAEISLW